MYSVNDSLGNIIRNFLTYKEASIFKFARGNNNWYITKR